MGIYNYNDREKNRMKADFLLLLFLHLFRTARYFESQLPNESQVSENV